jgi:hypothetical protein
MRKRNANSSVYAHDDAHNEEIQCEQTSRHHSDQQCTKQRRGNKVQQRGLVLCRRYRRSVCFVLGVIGFCVLQVFTFIVIGQVEKLASNADDNVGMDDDRTVSFLGPFRTIFSMLSEFTSSQHISLFLPSFRQQDHQPVLIIGGSDGSGTRAFVDTIRELGGVVVADDKETFDVHAEALFQHQGWPGLVYAVLNFTHTADYEWNDLIRLLTQDHVNQIEKESKYLLRELRAKYDVLKRFYRRAYLDRLQTEGEYEPIKGLSQTRHRGKLFSPFRTPGAPAPVVVRPTTFPALAKGISFVIKAPVSMLVLPIFCRLFKSATGKPIKFLHVIRDGRDVALSSNQSPVLKFYQSTYTDYAKREEKFSGSLWNVRAMQLWNDWNTDVYEWSMRHVSNQDGVVDYMWMRSEDLLPGSPLRYESLLALAQFVDSSLTPQQLCVLSAKNVRDYGRSVEHKELPPTDPTPHHVDIGERWKQQLEERRKAHKLREHHPKQHTRRRLREASGLPPEVIAENFVEEFETWKGLVENALQKAMEDTKKFVLDGLIRHGEDLAEQWNLDNFDSQAEKLKETVTKKEILDWTQKLRVRLQEARLYAHDKHQNNRPGDPDVKKRYGKWQGVLSNNTELSTYFYQEGAKGLELFGYHPEKDVHYLPEDNLQLVGGCVDGTHK